MKQVKRIRKRRRRSLSRWLVCGMLLVFSAFLFHAGWQDILTTFNIRSDIVSNQKDLDKLTAQQEDLEATKENLDNPDYVEYMARGKYLVSKQGEQVFKFPSLDLDE